MDQNESALVQLAESINDLKDRLDWIGTTNEKIYDVLMILLSHQGTQSASWDQEVLNYAHSVKHVLLSELTEEEFASLQEELREVLRGNK